jgi:predicted GIY-YIG superfamily endonuclease
MGRGRHRASDFTAAGGAGTVYLIHFDTPYKHARHYTGWASDLERRVADHRAGRGARLMEVIKDAGISWDVVRTWEGTRNLERAIKDLHEAPRLCPECSSHPFPLDTVRLMARQAEARASALESQPARELQSSPVLVPDPGASLPPVWPGQPAGPDVYRELDEATNSLVDGWRAASAAAEPELHSSAAAPVAAAEPDVHSSAAAPVAAAEPEAELELC